MLRTVALQLPPIRRLYDARNALLDENARLLAKSAGSNSPFFHYNTTFAAEDLIRRHAASNLAPDPKHVTNFLGVRINPEFFPTFLRGKEGTIEGIPIPANWHADIAEWAAALRAVELAHDRFAIIELGCGWGCWMNCTGVAARRAGLDVHLIGAEGDKGHVAFAREACATNGFAPEQVAVFHAIAAPQSGTALFPRQSEAGTQWGLEPIFGATAQERQAAIESLSHDELPMMALDELARPHPRIDLLHIDIQGGEVDLVVGCLDVICAKVAYMVIGTHSREIEGRLFKAMGDAGWMLEIERPAILALTENGPQVTVDGVQGWRNPRFRNC